MKNNKEKIREKVIDEFKEILRKTIGEDGCFKPTNTNVLESDEKIILFSLPIPRKQVNIDSLMNNAGISIDNEMHYSYYDVKEKKIITNYNKKTQCYTIYYSKKYNNVKLTKDNMEKIMNKINKLIRLSENNPNENESIAATLKAQELMNQYNIHTIDSINKENIIEIFCDTNIGNKWKYNLAATIASNFRCRVLSITDGKQIVFYGYESDAIIARKTFLFLYENCKKYTNKYVQKHKNDSYFMRAKDYEMSYSIGFILGIKDKLEKQSTVLAIIIPKEVNNKFEEEYCDCKEKRKTKNDDINWDKESYDNGYSDGKCFVDSKLIENN